MCAHISTDTYGHHRLHIHSYACVCVHVHATCEAVVGRSWECLQQGDPAVPLTLVGTPASRSRRNSVRAAQLVVFCPGSPYSEASLCPGCLQSGLGVYHMDLLEKPRKAASAPCINLENTGKEARGAGSLAAALTEAPVWQGMHRRGLKAPGSCHGHRGCWKASPVSVRNESRRGPLAPLLQGFTAAVSREGVAFLRLQPQPHRRGVVKPARECPCVCFEANLPFCYAPGPVFVQRESQLCSDGCRLYNWVLALRAHAPPPPPIQAVAPKSFN